MNEFKENADSLVKRVSQESQEIGHTCNLFLFANDPSEKQHYFHKLCASLEKVDKYWAELTVLFEQEKEDVSNQSVEPRTS